MPAYRVTVSVSVEREGKRYDVLEQSSTTFRVETADAEHAHLRATEAVRGGDHPMTTADAYEEHMRAKAAADAS